MSLPGRRSKIVDPCVVLIKEGDRIPTLKYRRRASPLSTTSLFQRNHHSMLSTLSALTLPPEMRAEHRIRSLSGDPSHVLWLTVWLQETSLTLMRAIVQKTTTGGPGKQVRP